MSNLLTTGNNAVDVDYYQEDRMQVTNSFSYTRDSFVRIILGATAVTRML